MITNKKKIISFALILLCANFVFAKPEFSLSWENSFLTGKADFEIINENFEWNYKDEMKGWQSLFTFRCKFNKYFSIGTGSGIGINKLHYASNSDMYNIDLLIPDSIFFGYVPIFGELRGILPVYNDLLSVYASSKIGGSILWQEFNTWIIRDFNSPTLEYSYFFTGGFFFEPELGLSLKLKRFLFDLGVAYHLQKLKYEVYYYPKGEYGGSRKTSEYPFALSQFALKLGLGIKFGGK